MKTVIVSDRLRLDSPLWDVDIVPWSSRPAIEGYPAVVLDLYFGEAGEEGFYPLGKVPCNFYELGTEVVRCLSAQGIVIALLGPVAVTDRSLTSKPYLETTARLKEERLRSGPAPPAGYESSYDWLDQGFLEATKLDTLNCRSNPDIAWYLPQTASYLTYRAVANSYWISIDGLEMTTRKTREFIVYPVNEASRWGSPAGLMRSPGWLIGRGEHTRLPVAAAIDYLGLGGLLVLMPPFSLDKLQSGQLQTRSTLVAMDLRALGAHFRDQLEVRAPREHLSWVYHQRASESKKISEEIRNHEARVGELEGQLAPYDNMLNLLDGSGTPLVNAVAQLFDQPDGGIVVSKTEKGAPIDLFISDGTGRSLAMEATSVKGALKKDDPHWADFLGHLPEHHSKNAEGRQERIVLVINTQRDTEVEKRDRGSDITSTVKAIVEDNHICVIRSVDLYDIWLKTLQGLSAKRVFDLLFNTEGVYEPKSQK